MTFNWEKILGLTNLSIT